eukprot:8148135-Pyramimonas_sp.AAC.1
MLGGYAAPRVAPGRLSQLYDLLLRRARGLHRKMVAPPTSSAQEACSELLGRPCLHNDTTNSLPLRPYAPHFVSWPDWENEPQWRADRPGASE